MHIASDEPDILLITEVIPKAQVFPIDPALLALTGYRMYASFNLTQERLGASGQRGICIYVKEELNSSPLVFCEAELIEQLWIQVKLEGADGLVVGCLYRSPSVNGRQSVDSLAKVLKTVCSKNPSHLLLTGDFNLPEIDWESSFSMAPDAHCSHAFIDLLNGCFLHQHVTEPTRYRLGTEPHILDLVITNEENMVKNLNLEAGLGLSDHVIIRFDLCCYAVKQRSDTVKLNFKKANFDRLNARIRDVRWETRDNETLYDYYEFFTDTMNSIIAECIPPTRGYPKRRNLYINSRALQLRRQKVVLWNTYVRTREPIDHARYARCRNQLRMMTRRLRAQYEEELAASMKQNPKRFWQYTNSRLKTRSQIEELQDSTGAVASSDKDKVTMLNRFFSSTFTIEDLNSIPQPPNRFEGEGLSDVVISPTIVETKLRSLRVTGSPGPDGIHSRVLREAASTIAVPLARLFRKSLDAGILPDEWKKGLVVPTFKKGSKHDPCNYRPISLTSIPCKILEAIVREEIMDHLSTHQLLSPDQYGFRPKRSCAAQLLHTLEDWSRMIEDGNTVDAIYVDYRKAFDAVPHQRLIAKLKTYGISGKLLEWIKTFLSGRSQQVVINGVCSDEAPVPSGVPQGSVLGPLLFVIYVNDMPDVTESPMKVFADDTKIYQVSAESSKLQADIDRILEWSKKWQLPFNDTKCQVLHIGSANPFQTYKMQERNLEVTLSEKDLGVQMDQDLKFRKQAAAAISKASKIMGVIKKSFQKLDQDTLPILFRTLVRPHLEYGNAVWGPFNRADQVAVEKVQRRATKLVRNIRHRPYTERLKLLNLPSLYYRRRRGDMILVYQIFHAGIDVHPEVFFDRATHSVTRGHEWKLRKPRAESRVRRNAFATRVVNDWNSLPPSIVNASSVNAFKSNLDAHWAEMIFATPYQDQ